MATTYAQGTLIWLKDEEEVWIPASIVSSNEKEIIVKKDFDEGGEPQIRLPPNEPLFVREQLIYTSEGLSVIDDLCQLTHLHEPAVLSSLNHRFDIDKIYTFTGPILIAMNPFKRIAGLYGMDIMYNFIKARTKSTKPHVYNTAMDCFRAICDRQKCQTVLISGESGAGKTETTKHVMAFLAAAGAEEGEQTDVERQVLESNPLLEAFGNARTLRNDNSSRFGKFINLQFQAHPDSKVVASSGTGSGKALRLCGARIQTYLLEKVRVFDHQEGERNYHIFYEGCAAFKKAGGNTYKFPQVLPAEKCQGMELEIDLDGFAPLEEFALLTRSTCKVLAGQDDNTEFENRLKAMQTIGVTKDQVQSILYVMAAVLHLGNTKFDAPPSNSEASQVMSESKTSFQKMVSLCKVDEKALEGAITNQTRVVMKEKVRSPVNIRQAADSRDALGKALYEMVFNFAVKIANQSIGYKPDVSLFVGVLDIFGFECFKMNSFEQLCINFTNERLQQFFNQFVFKLEEQLYEREGIAWDPLDFPDNQDSVDILQKRGDGVFAMLDEECVVPGGSDSGLCNKLIKKYKGHRRFDEIKTKPTWFVIKHFAGPVQYATEGFLDKNKDQLSTDIIDVMAESQEPLLKLLFQEDAKYAKKPPEEAPAGGGKKKKIYTVSAEFKDQLSSLMDIVDSTEPHFIRCIKPNPKNKPDEYDRKGVTEQLRYGGVLQVVQVSRAGYPVRITHQEAWDDYKICANADTVSGLRHVDDIKIRVQKLLEHLNAELNIPKPPHGGNVSWAVGKTMVFFKQVASERLEFSRRELLVKSTTMIQAHWRRKVRQDQYRALRVFTKHLQALLRGKESRAELLQLRREKAIVKMQALSRKHKDQKGYKIMLKYIIRVQAWRRGAVGRVRAKEYRKFTSATKIQAWFRKIRDRRVYKAFHRVMLVAQQRLRMHAAKSQMKKLKAEAKEVGALMAKSAKAAEQAAELRKKAEELEAQLLQADSEKGNLKNKAKTLEDQVAELTSQNEELKRQNEEASTQLNDPSKALVNSEEMEALKNQLAEKDGEMTTLKEEMAALKEAYAKSQEQLSGAESRYQQLLKSTAMQSMSNLGGPGAGGPAQSRPSLTGGAKPMNTASRSNRNVDIQIVGFQGTGKTPLMEELIKEYDPAQLQRFNEQKPNLMSHHQIQVGDRTLKLLDCSGNVRAQHLVKEWFGRSQWVFVVYDLCNAKSNETALELVRECVGAGARVMLLGNKFNNETQGQPIQVDVMAVKDAAARMEAWAMETANLHDAVKFAMNITDKEGPTGDLAGQGGAEGNDRRRSITAAIDSMKNWFGSSAPGGGGGPSSLATAGILRPSLKGTKAMKQARREGDSNADLRPVQELQDSESAVTCICFGQERLHKAYVLLATASKDGTVVIYRCYRTEMEVAMLQDTDFPQDDAVFSAPPADHSNIAVHSRLVGHSRAITSIFFNLLEDQLVTTSIDKSVRFWGVDSGEMLKVFTDSSAVPVAAFLPFNPQVFVAANSNAVLRLVNVQNGMVLQKLKVETEVRALKFDDTGLFLLAGTKNGGIHVLEASDSSTLKFKFKVQLARGGVTCITFVQASYGQPPCLLVNTSDSSATIIDCTYGPPAGVLTNLTVRHRVRVAHSLLPLKCCYSPSGQGYLISGSEDKEVYIYSLAKASNYKMQYLKHHQVPVVAVAVNLQDTLLASADSLGKIVLWRRMDFSHIAE